jgi:hypothetical protein
MENLHKINAMIQGKHIPNQIKEKKFTYSPTLQHAQGRCSAANKYSKSVMCITSKGQRPLSTVTLLPNHNKNIAIDFKGVEHEILFLLCPFSFQY